MKQPVNDHYHDQDVSMPHPSPHYQFFNIAPHVWAQGFEEVSFIQVSIQ
jgi:hypothetical protein